MYYKDFKTFCMNEGKMKPANMEFRLPFGHITELKNEVIDSMDPNSMGPIHRNWDFDEIHWRQTGIWLFHSKDLGVDMYVEPFYKGVDEPESEMTNQINVAFLLGDDAIDDEDNTMDDIDSKLTGDMDDDVKILRKLMHHVLSNAGSNENIVKLLKSTYEDPFEAVKDVDFGFPFVMVLLQQGEDPIPAFGSWQAVLDYFEEAKSEGFDYDDEIMHIPALVNHPVLGRMIRRNIKSRNLFGI